MTIFSATSSAVIILFSSLGLDCCVCPCELIAFSLILDAVNPGEAIKTCKSYFKFSILMDSRNPAIANFEAEYSDLAGRPL